MAAIAELLAQAKDRHRTGQLRDAEQLCLKVLQADPSNFEAHLLLGAVYHGLGKPKEAIASFTQAVQRRPDHAEAHSDLGAVLESQGSLDLAADCFRRALELKPGLVEAHNGLGVVLAKSGKLDEAIASLQQAWRLNPSFADALKNLRHVMATKESRLGSVLAEQGKLDEALACYRRAVELKPDDAEAHNGLGAVLDRQNHLEAAAACYRRALELKPDHVVALSNLGGVFWREGNLDAAADCYRRAVELKPDYAEAHNNLGAMVEKQGDSQHAIACYRRAVEITPDYAEAHFNLASALLQMGNFAEGWIEYEWRWKQKGVTEDTLQQPRWTGSALSGRTILLRAEQGLGDSLQFVRYAELVKQQGATVVVECPPALTRLLASCPGVDRVVTAGGDLGEFDCHTRLPSLPGILGTSLDNIPARAPYLWPDVPLVERWQAELGNPRAFKLGIAWQGSPTNKTDRFRSIPLAQFAGIVRTPGVRVYSLQMGTGREQLAALAGQWPIIDLGDVLGDFQNTAAIVRNLDLVITCDSAPAHLAGALGVPVWVALAFMPDWRWMLNRADSPWYPTMRLFRQRRPGDWQGVFECMERDLATIVAAR